MEISSGSNVLLSGAGIIDVRKLNSRRVKTRESCFFECALMQSSAAVSRSRSEIVVRRKTVLLFVRVLYVDLNLVNMLKSSPSPPGPATDL